MKTRFKTVAVTTSGTTSTPVALAPINTDCRFAVFVAALANTAPVVIGPGGMITAAAIVSGGTAYKAGDILLVTGGTYTVQGMLRVDAVDVNGVITAASVWGSGIYQVLPNTTNSPTGGSGTTASFTLTITGPTGCYTVQPGQSCPLIPVVIPMILNPMDAGDWAILSTAATQAGTLLFL